MASEQQPSWEWPGYTQTIHRSVYEAIDPTNPINSTAGKVVLVTGELPKTSARYLDSEAPRRYTADAKQTY